MLATKKLSDYQKLVNALRPDHAASQQQQQHQHQQTSSAAIDTLVDFSFTGQSVPTSSTEKLYPTIHNDDFNPRAPVSQAHNASPSSSSKVTTASRTGGIDLPGKAGPVPLHITPEQLEGVPDGFIKHFVNKNDTLIGISMRYGITKVQLIRANQGLAHDNLYAFYDVKIPIDRENITIEKKEETEEDRQRERNKSIARFRRSQNVGEAEARFYLSENEFDVSKAIKERQADVEFERKYAQKHHDLPIAEKYVSPRKPFF
jgi:LysM repeat protein